MRRSTPATGPAPALGPAPAARVQRPPATAQPPRTPPSSRGPRQWKCGHVYHVYQRGSQRHHAFLQPSHLLLYLNRLDRLARRCQVRIHAFCLLSNQVHFLFEPRRKGAISLLMQHLQSYHARYMNGLRRTHGHLWRNHFHAQPVTSEEHYRETLLFIEQTATASSSTRQAYGYPYSSARAHLANQATYVLKHKRQSAEVTLYLKRWQSAFGIPASGPTAWSAWLFRAPTAAFLRQVARLIVHPPPPPVVLAVPEASAQAAARGS